MNIRHLTDCVYFQIPLQPAMVGGSWLSYMGFPLEILHSLCTALDSYFSNLKCHLDIKKTATVESSLSDMTRAEVSECLSPHTDTKVLTDF